MTTPAKLEIIPLLGFPQLDKPCNLGELVAASLNENQLAPQQGDVLVVAHKIISKAEGAVVDLTTVTPSDKAIEMAEQTGKEPELVEVILSQSTKIVRQGHGVIICENLLGLICANAGVDRSNAGEDKVVLLPENPDQSANQLRQTLKSQFDVDVAVLVADTHGRPWREGAIGMCIGLSGADPFVDYRGRHDLYDYEMQTEVECVADELCAAATLLMGQGNEGIPLVLVKGAKLTLDHQATSDGLLRDPERDLFR